MLPHMLIAITAIIVPFAFVAAIVGMVLFDNRKKAQLHHETIRLAIEKGQPVPAELLKVPVNVEEKRKPSDRKGGLILIAVGAGLYFFLLAVGNATDKPIIESARWASLIPGLIGVAMLVNHFLERGEKDNGKS